MTTAEWAEVMTGDPLELAAYLDFLEEDGEDPGAARDVPYLASKILADRLTMWARYGSDTYVCVIFRHHHRGSDRPGAYCYSTALGTYWPHRTGFTSEAAALLAHGAYYGSHSAWFPVIRWAELAMGFRRAGYREIKGGFEVKCKFTKTSS